jgi:hypothetical protein
MSSVEKNLICLEDIAVGTGIVVQDRGGALYTLRRIDLVPSVDSVEDLDGLVGFNKAKIGHITYVKVDDEWVIDPIPLAALGDGLGTAASRNATGAGDVLAKGYAGIGGAALTAIAGELGLRSALVSSIAAGGPANEPAVVLTLPGADADAARIAITLTNVAMYYQKVGFAWIKVVAPNTDVTFAALKANSVRADSVGTPKD